MPAAILAILIMGWFSIDNVNNWIALVVTLVVAIVGLGQSILSALNTDRDEPQGWVLRTPKSTRYSVSPPHLPAGRRGGSFRPINTVG